LPIRRHKVARPKRGGQAVAVLVEDEERVIAHGLEVPVVGGLLLGAVNRALGAVDIQDQTPRGRAAPRSDMFSSAAATG
jgi:hypothetical protein